DSALPGFPDITVAICPRAAQSNKQCIRLPGCFSAVDAYLTDLMFGERQNRLITWKKSGEFSYGIHPVKLRFNHSARLRLYTGTVEQGSPTISDATTGVSLCVRAI